MDAVVQWLITMFTRTVDPSLLLTGFERLATSAEHLV